MNAVGVTYLNFLFLLNQTVGPVSFGGNTPITGTFNASTPGGYFAGTGNLVAPPEPASPGCLGLWQWVCCSGAAVGADEQGDLEHATAKLP